MRDIPSEVVRINQLLIDHYGIDGDTGAPFWRVVWSDDQFEKRLMDTTDEGLSLLYPEVREVPKYRQWIPHKWVLEKLTVIPDFNSRELPVSKHSYEPMFPFEDRHGDAIPASFEASKFVIDRVYEKMGKKSTPKYKDPESTQESHLHIREQELKRLESELFGDENDITDALAYKEGVALNNMDMKKEES